MSVFSFNVNCTVPGSFTIKFAQNPVTEPVVEFIPIQEEPVVVPDETTRHQRQDTEFDRRSDAIVARCYSRGEDFRTLLRFIKENYNRETGAISCNTIKEGLRTYIRAAYPDTNIRRKDARLRTLLQEIAHKALKVGKPQILERFDKPYGTSGPNPTYYVHSDILNA